MTRNRDIFVEYQDLNGNTKFIEFYGHSAIIFQHEYDHLDGILFIDHFNEEDKKESQPRLDLLANISGSDNYVSEDD